MKSFKTRNVIYIVVLGKGKVNNTVKKTVIKRK